MIIKIVGSIPELMVHMGFNGTVDYLVRQGADELLAPVLQIEAQAQWMRTWINKPVIKDTTLSAEDEKKLWENFEQMKKAMREGLC